MTQNEEVYAILCRPEVYGDVISSRIVNTLKGYVAVYFEAASFSGFREFPNILWR